MPTITREEKALDMQHLAYALLETMARKVVESELNHAEAINAVAHVLASILAGAYHTDKDRQIVLSAFPDVVDQYIPQWEEINKRHTQKQ